ncbi:hypothetical protein F6P94_15265 [Escherichia coli]|nr:hypothetical protein F6P94_15265 [Escherichia coli]
MCQLYKTEPAVRNEDTTGTSLAWFRTMLGYGALMALAIKHNWHQAGMLFWISIGILAIVALILWHYTRNRNLMDVTNSDFSQFHVVRDKFLISLAVLSLCVCCNINLSY